MPITLLTHILAGSLGLVSALLALYTARGTSLNRQAAIHRPTCRAKEADAGRAAMKAVARRAGLLSLLILILAPLNNLFLSSGFIVPGDSAATLRNIDSHHLAYRLGILSGLASDIALLLLVVILYRLLVDVDRKRARLMVTLMILSVGYGLVNFVHQAMPLILLNGAQFWSPFAQSQMDALAYAFLRLGISGIPLATAFWGLCLIPFGVLVFKWALATRGVGRESPRALAPSRGPFHTAPY